MIFEIDLQVKSHPPPGFAGAIHSAAKLWPIKPMLKKTDIVTFLNRFIFFLPYQKNYYKESKV